MLRFNTLIFIEASGTEFNERENQSNVIYKVSPDNVLEYSNSINEYEHDSSMETANKIRTYYIRRYRRETFCRTRFQLIVLWR